MNNLFKKDLLKPKFKGFKLSNKTKVKLKFIIKHIIFNKFFNHLFSRKENLNLYNVLTSKLNHRKINIKKHYIIIN